jgi:uncharacterized ion transporter superfamily protein YfcC
MGVSRVKNRRKENRDIIFSMFGLVFVLVMLIVMEGAFFFQHVFTKVLLGVSIIALLIGGIEVARNTMLIKRQEKSKEGR